MIIQHNFLRLHRKRSQLTQSDIAFILDLADYSNISRWEQGVHKPSIDILLVYHLLFDIPIESLFERQRSEIAIKTLSKIQERIARLKDTPPDNKVQQRISFMQNALGRLMSFYSPNV